MEGPGCGARGGRGRCAGQVLCSSAAYPRVPLGLLEKVLPDLDGRQHDACSRRGQGPARTVWRCSKRRAGQRSCRPASAPAPQRPSPCSPPVKKSTGSVLAFTSCPVRPEMCSSCTAGKGGGLGEATLFAGGTGEGGRRGKGLHAQGTRSAARSLACRRPPSRRYHRHQPHPRRLLRLQQLVQLHRQVEAGPQGPAQGAHRPLAVGPGAHHGEEVLLTQGVDEQATASACTKQLEDMLAPRES